MPSPQFIDRPVQELFGRHPGYGFAGFGVSTAIGNYTGTAVDLGFPGGLLGLLDLTRTYNSLSTAAGTLGQGWTHSFAASIQPAAKGGLLRHAAAAVTFTDVDGRVLTFTPNAAGGFNRAQDLDADLVRNADGTFTLTYNSGQVWAFDANGRATSRSWEGQNVAFDYDAGGSLLRATHSAGPHLSLSYDGNGRLTAAEASDGRTVTYAYAADGTLASVTDPADGTTRYTVADGTFQVTDADGNIVVSNTPASGAVTHQDFPTGGHADFTYDAATGVTTITSQSGAVMTFQADTNGRMTKVTDPNGNASAFSYDSNGYLAEASSPGGTRLTQAHDDRGNVLSSVYGGAATSYSYDTSNRPTSITDPVGGTVRYAYSGTTQVPPGGRHYPDHLRRRASADLDRPGRQHHDVQL
jgi:YD repeat-containing protein